jgi:peptidoglycan L-alanyl-D-glutamate endopeptidase CwlK
MGNSKVKWPNSKHNSKPSRAVDIAPYINGKLSWKDEDCVALSKHILGVASRLGVPLRWGGDFNMDGDKTKYDAWDKPHYELVTIKTPKEKET